MGDTRRSEDDMVEYEEFWKVLCKFDLDRVDVRAFRGLIEMRGKKDKRQNK